MLLGLVGDIHDHARNLRTAIAIMRQRGVDQVVALGDMCESYGKTGPGAEVIALLRESQAVGVWGNHDFGLCCDISDELRSAMNAEDVAYMSQMKASLTIDDCLFCHIEPWRDAASVEGLWSHDGLPQSVEAASRSFDAVAQRRIFIGHFHCWLVMTPRGRLEWDAAGPIELAADDRHLVVVAPVADGWCAMYDTDQSILTPVRCG